MAFDNRGRLLKLVNIFEEYCNDENGIDMNSILDKLRDSSGESFGRKAVYRDIDVINTVTDMKIEYDERLKTYKFKRESAFTKEETGIIINALLTARFISRRDTREIIEKFYKLTGLKGDKDITGHISLQDRIKIENSGIKVRQNIGIIRKQIAADKKIQFDYVKYNTKKSLIVEKQGCIVSPYDDVWYQDYYYMIGNYGGNKLSHYRIDRMKNIKVLEDKRKSIGDITGKGGRFNVAEYMSKLVGMASGYEDYVVITFKREHIGEVIDNLGDKVSIQENGPDYFTLRALVLINKKFVKWILSFGDGAIIREPDNLREKVVETVKSQLESYKSLKYE